MNQFYLRIGHNEEDSNKFLVTEDDNSFVIGWSVGGRWFTFPYPKKDVAPTKEELIAALKSHFAIVEEI